MISSCLTLVMAWLMTFVRVSGRGAAFPAKDSEIISGWASRMMDQNPHNTYNIHMTDKHEEESKRIFIRLRCIIIHDDKLLASYSKEHDFYFFPGGHMLWGESIIDGVKREIKEELGNEIEFEFKKVLFIREFLEKEHGKHSLELFILGDINKHKELEGKLDPEHENGLWWTTWLDLNNLPANLYPEVLAKKIASEYKKGFPSQGEYVGMI